MNARNAMLEMMDAITELEEMLEFGAISFADYVAAIEEEAALGYEQWQNETMDYVEEYADYYNDMLLEQSWRNGLYDERGAIIA